MITAPLPLTAHDRRDQFDCGRAALNLWFQRHAWRNQQSGVSRTNVVRATATGLPVGFVSLSAAQIARAYLAKPGQRNQPDPLPAILLGQLAVDAAWQKRGIAHSLVVFALATACRLAQDIGCFGVVTHPLDDGLRRFYRNRGFEDLPFDPHRGMIVRIKDLAANGF